MLNQASAEGQHPHQQHSHNQRGAQQESNYNQDADGKFYRWNGEADRGNKRQWKPAFGEHVLKASRKGRDRADACKAVREKIEPKSDTRERIGDHKIGTILVAGDHFGNTRHVIKEVLHLVPLEVIQCPPEVVQSVILYHGSLPTLAF